MFDTGREFPFTGTKILANSDTENLQIRPKWVPKWLFDPQNDYLGQVSSSKSEKRISP